MEGAEQEDGGGGVREEGGGGEEGSEGVCGVVEVVRAGGRVLCSCS